MTPRNRPGELTRERIDAFKTAEQHLEPKNFAPYLRLKELLHDKSPDARAEFRKTFKSFYMMRPGTGASPAFDQRFFEILFSFNPLADPNRDFSAIVGELAPIKDPRGRTRLQFSFVSKLVAIHQEASPIYDKHVKNFFGESNPPYRLHAAGRIAYVADFLEFVAGRYKGWSQDPRLAAILDRVRDRDPRLWNCDAVRLVDFLVWRVGNLAQKKPQPCREPRSARSG